LHTLKVKKRNSLISKQQSKTLQSNGFNASERNGKQKKDSTTNQLAIQNPVLSGVPVRPRPRVLKKISIS